MDLDKLRRMRLEHHQTAKFGRVLDFVYDPNEPRDDHGMWTSTSAHAAFHDHMTGLMGEHDITRSAEPHTDGGVIYKFHPTTNVHPDKIARLAELSGFQERTHGMLGRPYQKGTRAFHKTTPYTDHFIYVRSTGKRVDSISTRSHTDRS